MNPNGRIKTYIEGYDRALEGGVPQGQVVLVAGTPGTMKSSLTYYILYNQAKEEGATCVYVTLEQSRASLLRQMEKMGMATEDVKHSLHILDLGLIRKNLKHMSGGDSWMQVFKGYITSLKNDLNFDIIAIDSLGVLETISEMGNRRTDMFYHRHVENADGPGGGDAEAHTLHKDARDESGRILVLPPVQRRPLPSDQGNQRMRAVPWSAYSSVHGAGRG